MRMLTPARFAPGLVLLAGACWGLIGLFSRPLAAAGLDALQITFLRCLLSALVLGGCLATRRSPGRQKLRLRDVWLFIGTGVCSIAFFNICYFHCMAECGLSVSCILLYTAPLFVMLMSCLCFRERFSARKGLALALAFGGCVLTAGLGGGETLSAVGLLTGLGAGVGYALYSIIGKLALRRYDSAAVIFLTFVFGALALLPFSRPAALAALLLAAPRSLASAAALCLVSTLLPFFCYTGGLAHLEAGRASVFSFAEPLTATLLGVLVFREPLTGAGVCGMLLIAAAVLLLARQAK